MKKNCLNCNNIGAGPTDFSSSKCYICRLSVNTYIAQGPFKPGDLMGSQSGTTFGETYAKKYVCDRWQPNLAYLKIKPEDLVTLEDAKILKEKGYSTPTIYYWLGIDVPFVTSGLKCTKNGVKLNHNRYDDFIYSAPLKKDADMWLMKKESKKVKEIIDISDMDLTSNKYKSFVKNLKVGDKFKIDANGIYVYIIDMKEYITLTKGKLYEATTTYVGEKFGEKSSHEYEVINTNVDVNIDSFTADDNPIKCFIYKRVGELGAYVFAMPNKW